MDGDSNCQSDLGRRGTGANLRRGPRPRCLPRRSSSHFRAFLPRQRRTGFACSRGRLGPYLGQASCGSTFRKNRSEVLGHRCFVLPPLPPLLPSAAIPEGGAALNREILLIEDEATLSLLLRERLEKEGYSVTTCKDGEQGLARAVGGNFHLLLLDVKLP